MTKGELIRERRKALKMTQDDLASATGVTKATVSRWESGDIHKMKEQQVISLARVLQIDSAMLARDEVLFGDEVNIIRAYRMSEEWQKRAVRQVLNIKEEGENA